MSWAVSGGRLTLEHDGSDTVLIACRPPRSHRWNCLWPPGVRVGHTFSSWNNSYLHALVTMLISYYLKLKFFNIWAPHPLQLSTNTLVLLSMWLRLYFPILFEINPNHVIEFGQKRWKKIMCIPFGQKLKELVLPHHLFLPALVTAEAHLDMQPPSAWFPKWLQPGSQTRRPLPWWFLHPGMLFPMYL